MTITWFAIFRADAAVSSADHARVLDIVRTTPGLVQGRVFTPESAHDPYLNDGPPPPLALQLYFDDIATLEAALAPDGHLQALARPDTLPSLARAQVVQQAMLARGYPVPDDRIRTPSGSPHCTYLVAYPGPAEDLNAWLWHYIRHHPGLMAKMPGVRQIEICTRIDWCGFLPWPRADAMQRNKVVFDSAAALNAALASPVRQEMRADFDTFPPFAGGNVHFPMATIAV